MGPNGAGKSTLLSTIAGLLRPKRGTVLFEGASIVGQRPDRIVRRGISLVPEGRRIFAKLTVGENLRVALSGRRDRRGAAEDWERILELFPILSRFLSQTAGKLSGGEQQQLAIARALLTRPKILLLDEPSLGLAPLMVKLVFETIAGLRAAGTTILLVEQNAAGALAIADRAWAIRSGRVEASGHASELLADERVKRIYLGLE